MEQYFADGDTNMLAAGQPANPTFAKKKPAASA